MWRPHRFVFLTLFGAVLNSRPVSLDISAATLTSNPFLVLRPYIQFPVSLQTHRQRRDAHSSDSGTTLGEETQTRQDIFHSRDAIRKLLNVATEFLSKGKRSSVLDLL